VKAEGGRREGRGREGRGREGGGREKGERGEKKGEEVDSRGEKRAVGGGIKLGWDQKNTWVCQTPRKKLTSVQTLAALLVASRASSPTK
jgi:hypothetical protein